MSLTEAVKAEAHRLGFQLVGVTTPEPPPHFPVFERWLAAGLQGEMAYLSSQRARERRADPRQILPECRSILVLGIRYPAPQLESQAGTEEGATARLGLRGRVASYAWGQDYHEVLPERLKALVAFIEEQVGGPFPHRWYTDTGPVLERDLAQRAGLGWIGKNSCLIHPSLGSYFLLAEVLLGIKLDPDLPFTTDHCGTCRRCIDACPTECILPDRTLDARRCISYLTIELKSPIPLELRSQMGDWVFGCDICQQVCPWNVRFSTPEGDPVFAPAPGRAAPGLVEELRLGPGDFKSKFKGAPLTRSKRRGYLRNVVVALGNSGDPSAVPALSQALLVEPEALVRGHAAWALGQIGGEAARKALEQAVVIEKDAWVLAEIEAALS